LEGKPAGTLTDGEHQFHLFWFSKVTEPNVDPRENLKNILMYFLGLPSRLPADSGAGPTETAFTDAQATETLMSIDPTLSYDQALQKVITARTQRQQDTLSQASPAVQQAAEQSQTAVAHEVHMTATGPLPGGNQLINLHLLQGTIADVLDMNNDAWTLFEDGVIVPIDSRAAIAGSLWNYLHLFVDPLFQEFFTRIEEGVCKIHFRGKPFVDHPVTQGTRFQDNDPTLSTQTLDWDRRIATDLRRDSTQVYNAFRVFPLGASTQLQTPSFLYQITPTIFTNADHPSYIRKYGLRDLMHLSPYLNGMPTTKDTPKDQTDGAMTEAAKRWSAIVAAWYGYAPELYAGTLTVPGSPRWNIGIRLWTQDPRGEREAYVEGVDHTYNFLTGQYVTTLRVTRMWYLSGVVDDQGITQTEFRGEPAPTVSVTPTQEGT